MKKLLLVLITLISSLTYSQCMLNADFSYVSSGGNVSFTNTSTNEPAIPYYQWDYNGQSSTMENPTFPQAATDEVVCFTVYDSTWTCYDSLCVLIPGDSTICNLNITWTQSISGGNITFTNTSTGEPSGAYYSWLYNGMGSTLENPTFPYDSTVTQVCFAIGDPLGTCEDSICGPVYPDSTGGCNLNISWTQSISGGSITFTNTSTGEPASPQYAWLYNGMSSSLENPTFPYDSTVTQVCFAIYGATNPSCQDSICGPVYPDSTGGCNLNISWTQSISGGNITFTNTSTGEPAVPQYAWLYDGMSSSLENPTFPYNPSVTQVCFAIYGLTNPSCQDSICGPVYPDSTGGCNLVASFTHTVGGASIFFTNTSTNEPSGAMYSWTFHGQSSNLEDPIFTQEPTDGYACLTVYDSTWNCYDSTCVFIPGFASCNLIADFTFTIDSGLVYFTNTSTNEPAGANYDWWYGGQSSSLENPVFYLDSGITYACLTVFDSAWNCYDSTCFLVDPLTAGQDELTNEMEINVYPNPVENDLFINILSGSVAHRIEIYDASGRLVYSDNIENMNNLINVNVSDLHSGIYLMTITGDDQHVRHTERFIKR